jgi:hypothetical protein
MKLGERLDVVMLTLKGDSSMKSCVTLANELVIVLGMNKVHEPTFYKYPVNGQGGFGFTFIQPISESFIAIDSWSDFEGVYLLICSCKTVNLNKVSKKVRKLGFRIKQIKANELNLGRKYGF